MEDIPLEKTNSYKGAVLPQTGLCSECLRYITLNIFLRKIKHKPMNYRRKKINSQIWTLSRDRICFNILSSIFFQKKGQYYESAKHVFSYRVHENCVCPKYKDNS